MGRKNFPYVITNATRTTISWLFTRKKSFDRKIKNEKAWESVTLGIMLTAIIMTFGLFLKKFIDETAIFGRARLWGHLYRSDIFFIFICHKEEEAHLFYTGTRDWNDLELRSG